MSEIVGGISMSHAPGLVGWPEQVADERRVPIFQAVERIRAYLDEIRPDVVVAFIDDHFENFTTGTAPTFAIGVADSHRGPIDYFVEMLRMKEAIDVPGAPGLARTLLAGTIAADFDVARVGRIQYGNNLMAVWPLIRPEFDIPVIPVFTNVFSPPVPTMDRAYRLGEAIRSTLQSSPGAERVVVLATGGLSHWPPLWLEHFEDQWPAEMQPYMARMKRYQAQGPGVLLEDPGLFSDLAKYEMKMADLLGRPVVNPGWDRQFLDLLAAGDAKAIRNLSYEEIESGAGFGGHEVLNWTAAMGAMDGARATVLSYEAVPEWVCGMGFAIYE
jgi:2,3-dihydroxyphenylpropionate 1,2-dioxygenase